MSNIDFGLTAKDYAQYRAGFPDIFFDRLMDEKVVRPGQTLIDLGTGTGTIARGFAKRGCKVIAIDPSESLMAQAKELDKQAGVKVEYRTAKTEETGLSDSCADVVVAGQCWHWFERPKAAQEVNRILKAKGTIIIAHFDWIPLKGNFIDATEKLILEHNPQWKLASGTGLYPVWLRDLGEANFINIHTYSFDVDVPYSPEAWRGRIRASAGVGASLPPEQVNRFDAELKALLEAKYPSKILQAPHRVFVVIANKL